MANSSQPQRLRATYNFTRGFLWGTATSSYQVEGSNTNNQWYAWEQAGRTGDTSGLTCDWWGGRWLEDFDRAAQAHQNAHRLSIEWSRIQPAPDAWDDAALERYRVMLRGLRERGIQPMVTLHHFTDPLWLTERHGWETAAVIPLFEAYVRRVVLALQDFCDLWCTLNEPNIYTGLGYIVGSFPPGGGGLPLALKVLTNMARAHAAAYRAIHEIQPQARVGYALHYRPAIARRSWFPPDVLMARLRHLATNLGFPGAISTGVMPTPLGRIRMPEVRGTQDFFGLNYYASELAWIDVRRPGELFTHVGLPPDAEPGTNGVNANFPRGFYDAIHWVVRTFPDLPIYVTENGIDSTDDALRRRFIAQHVHQIWRAINFNWQIFGYFYWTLVDNFEWERGWSQRFGLWELDPVSQARTKRPSADLYAQISRTNSLSSDMVLQYCPEVYDKIFPPFGD